MKDTTQPISPLISCVGESHKQLIMNKVMFVGPFLNETLFQ